MRFSPEEAAFIRAELGIQVSENETDDSILEDIWEAACEIEVEESNRLDVLTLRGKMAVALVTKIGGR